MTALGRLEQPDSRDANYPLRALIPVGVVLPKFRYYSVGPILDQGQVPACTAYAWKQWLDSSPVRDPEADPPEPLSFYAQEQAIDGFPLPHDGSTVRAGAQVLQQAGRIKSYHWAASIDDVIEYVLSTSTVVFGTPWTNNMFTPDARGFAHPTGMIAGGHAYLCVGYNQRTRALRFVNSWGTTWGQHGRFWLTQEDAAGLLADQGEACAALEAAG